MEKKKETASIFSSKLAFSDKSNDSGEYRLALLKVNNEKMSRLWISCDCAADGSKSDSDGGSGRMFSTYSSSSLFDKPSPAKKGASTRGRSDTCHSL